MAAESERKSCPQRIIGDTNAKRRRAVFFMHLQVNWFKSMVKQVAHP
jgi:hypothetical protein